MLGSNRLVSPLSSRVAPMTAPDRYGSEEGDEHSTRVQFRLTSPAELAMLPDFSEFDAASTPQATDHITVQSRPTDSAATAGGAVDLQQRIQAQKSQTAAGPARAGYGEAAVGNCSRPGGSC